MIIRYDSTAALRQDYIKCLHGGIAPSRERERVMGRRGLFRDSWYNNEDVAESLHLAEVGNTSLVPEAEVLLDQLDLAIETPRKVWERSPAGAFCSVPDVLAGLPTPMRRQITTSDEVAPITVLCTTTSSAGISAATLKKRGTVVLALVMALTRIRPVSLQQLTFLDGRDNGETIITSEINTTPLDLATACYVLTSAGFARRLTYDLSRVHNSFTGGWPRNYRFSWGKSLSENPYYSYLKEKLTPDPTKCLLIPAAELGDELLKTPIAWIQKQINAFAPQEE